jgi:hypothetical protein
MQSTMLPVLRILPVGGVLLAIMLLVLALNPPAGTRAALRPDGITLHGAMIDRNAHPEWRQRLILAAIQRAAELDRLRELPDIPTVIAPPVTAPAPPEIKPTIAGLPASREDAAPDLEDTTGSIVPPPAAALPIDIGETSAFELPVATPEEKAPAIMTPLRLKSRNESRVKARPRAHRARAAVKTQQPAQTDFFQALFGDQKKFPSPNFRANPTAR